MNRGHGRRQFDTQKPLIKVESADDFFTKENEENTDSINPERSNSFNTNGKLKKENTLTETTDSTVPAPKKQEIIIPVAKQVEDPLKSNPEYEELLYKKRKLQTHYIRIDYINPKPTPDLYEPTDKDLQFIKELNEKLPKVSRGSNVNEITMQNFAHTIEAWENATEKGDVISLIKAVGLVENYYSGALKDFPPKIYEYWKSLREVFQRPLLRKYLKAVNKDDNNPNAAFRFREANKMKTRRTQRNSEADNLEKMKILRQDLDMAMTLIGNVKYREMIKLEICELSNIKLESSLREKADTASNAKLIEKYKENFENEAYLKLRNRMKEYNNNAVKIIDKFNESNKDETIATPIPTPSLKPQPINPDEELKFDLGSFIASILDESLSRDITPENITKMLIEEPTQPNPYNPPVLNKPIDKPVTIFPDISDPLKLKKMSIPPVEQLIKVKPPVDEKSIDKFILRRRIGRQKRILLDRIFEEDENSLYSHPRDFYQVEHRQKNLLLSGDVSQKLANNNLKDLYFARFGKFSDICPFNDSEEESEINESTKMIKTLASNFKIFVKQRRPTNSVV